MITVLADDLTGAAEITGICLRYGLEVAFGIDTLPEKVAPITIVATDSRSMTENQAFEIHRRLAEKVLTKKENQIIFKKCDSALRGYVLTELVALLEATGKNSVLLQPANPVGNRCIRTGSYFINDILITETGFEVDPDFPAQTSSVQQLLLNRTSRISNPEKIHLGNIQSINSDGFYIPDCNSETDLANAVELFNEKMIIGGSAAFFEQFLLKQFPSLVKREPKKYRFSDRYLLISGSTQPESIQFAKELQEKNCPVAVFPEPLLKKDSNDSELAAWTEELISIYSKNKKLALRVSDSIIQFESSSKILKNRMSLVVQQLLEHSNINELFIEGGATAYDVLQKLNWKSFTPVAELALGVVRMQYDLDPKKHITLKPGSYKWPENLLQ